jgi:hypothetical protein
MSSANQTGGDQQPAAVADDGNRPASLVNAADELLGEAIIAKSVGVHGSAGEQNCVELVGICIGESLIDFDHSSFLIVLNGLDFARVRGDDNGGCSGFIESLARFDEFGFFKEIGGKDGHSKSLEALRHIASLHGVHT